MRRNTFADDTERKGVQFQVLWLLGMCCIQILALMKFRLFQESAAAARCRHAIPAGRLPPLKRRLYSAGGFPQLRFGSKIKMDFLLLLGYKCNYIYQPVGVFEKNVFDLGLF